MTDARIVRVNPRVITISVIIFILSWATSIILWLPAIFLAPAIAALSYLATSLRTRAVALKWIMLIPASRFDDKLIVAETVAHERRHVIDQESTGLFLFILKWITPSGCIALESRGYARNISVLMRRQHFTYVKRKRIYLDSLILHFSNVIKNDYPQVRWSRYSIFDIAKVLRKAVEDDQTPDP